VRLFACHDEQAHHAAIKTILYRDCFPIASPGCRNDAGGSFSPATRRDADEKLPTSAHRPAPGFGGRREHEKG
jgi:hypothetical protein